MKPTAYLTQDRRMLIFADSPNMMPADTSNLIPLFELDEMTTSFSKVGVVGCGKLVRCNAGYDKVVIGLCGDSGNALLCTECLGKSGSKSAVEECRGFKLNDSVAYYRFNTNDKPILGRIRNLVDREGARGAWVADSETGEVYFAPFSRLAHLKREDRT